MIIISQSRREVTIRSARLDSVTLYRVVVTPAIDTTMPAIPTNAKAPSTALMVAQLALRAPAILDENGDQWSITMDSTTGIPTFAKIAMALLLLSLPIYAAPPTDGIVVNKATRETAQAITFTGNVTAIGTADSNLATRGFARSLSPTSIAWGIITGSPTSYPPSSHGHAYGEITGTPTALAPTAHALTHSSTGSDVITPASIGAEVAGTAAALIESTAMPRVRVLERNGLFLAIQSAITTNLIWQWGYETFWDQYESEAAIATKTNAYYDAANDLYTSTTPGGTDICTGGTPTCSGSVTASALFDNNFGAGGNFGMTGAAWVIYHLAAPAAVTSYSIVGASGTANPEFWVFSGSNDGTNWTVLDARTGQNTATKQTYAVSNGTSYAYYRWSSMGRTGNDCVVYEMELFAPGSLNITIISTMQETVDVPTGGTLMLIIAPIDAITVNTDVKTYLTRDGGSTWCELTLTKADGITPLAGYEAWIGDVTLTGGSGAGAMSAGYKIQSFGETPKAFNIKAVAFQVRP